MIALIIFFLAIVCYLLGIKNISLILFFTLPTSGFQIIPFSLMVLPEIGLTKTYDLGIIFLMFLYIIEYKKVMKILSWHQHNEIFYLFILATLVLGISIFMYKYSFIMAIRPYRGYIFLLSFLFFELYTFRDLEKVFKILVFITFLQSILYILQNPLGLSLLNSGIGDEIFQKTTGSFTRYYNLPVLLIPCLLYCAFFIKKFPKYISYTYLVIFLGVIILSLHRNLLFAMLLVIFFATLKNMNLKKLILYTIVGTLGFFISYIFLADRIDEGLNNLREINHISINNNSAAINYDASSTNTSLFRAFHFLERFEYIYNNSKYFIAGVGFLTEDATQAQSLHFMVGLKDESGQISQLNTADIAWSILILNFGIIGTAIFIFLIIRLLIKYFKLFSYNYARLCICYLLLILIISFYGTDLVSIYFKLMFPLLAVLSRKELVQIYTKRKISEYASASNIHHNAFIQPS